MSSLAVGLSSDRTAGKSEASATAEPVPVAECLDDAVVVFAPGMNPVASRRYMPDFINQDSVIDNTAGTGLTWNILGSTGVLALFTFDGVDGISLRRRERG